MFATLQKSLRKRCYWLALNAAALAIAPAIASADPSNGGEGIPLDDPPITVGADWFASLSTPPAFFWGAGVDAPNDEGPFTFTSVGNVVVDVTDDFDKGDRFEVFDFGVSLGLTTLVAEVAGAELGPEAAFNDPTYSSGSFPLGAGDHSITMETVVNPFGGGRGYLRVLVPEPTALTLITLGMFGCVARRRPRR